MTNKTSLSYKDAGVDIDAGNALVDRIKGVVKKTRRPEVMGGLGGFGALCALPQKYREPVLVSGTDGVGTKLRLAMDLKRHDTIGIDLVAMCVNDLVVQGAEPLFFLDYYATGKLDVDTAASVINGIAEGCLQSGCALVGGYMLLVGRLIWLAVHTPDSYGAHIIVAVTGVLLFHIIENLCMVIGLLPVTGIPLPFVSYGGSNMLTNMAAIGLVQNVVIRTKKQAQDNLTSGTRPVNLAHR